MGTEEGSKADSAESFCPTDEEIEKWMDRAFDVVGETFNYCNKSDLHLASIMLHTHIQYIFYFILNRSAPV